MNRTEISEIRRRFNPDKNTITRLRGCYVNEKREVISTFDRSLLAMPREEANLSPIRSWAARNTRC